MKNRLKRVISLWLAFVLALGVLPELLVPSAAAGFTTSEPMSTSIGMLKNNTVYIVSQNVSLTNAALSQPALSVENNATAVLYIKSGCTLTLTGGAAKNGTSGGGAGLMIPSSSTLIVTGGGRLVATGGAGLAGTNGTKGTNAEMHVGGDEHAVGGPGGKGGNGAYGPGAGIGGNGGKGGNGGDGGGAPNKNTVGVDGWDEYGYRGSDGGAGSAGGTMGKLYVLGKVSVSAQMGSSKAYGNGGGYGAYANDAGSGWKKDYSAGGGGGGGGGGDDSYETYGIGGGNGGGGGGGGGNGGGVFWITRDTSGYQYTNGRGGGGGVSNGGSGGTNTTINRNGDTDPSGTSGYIRNQHGDSPAATSGGSVGSHGGCGGVYKDTGASISGSVQGGIKAASMPDAIKYTPTLSFNDGTTGSTTATCYLGYPMPTLDSVPTRTGYTFEGYYDTSANTGGTKYFDSEGKSAGEWDKAANVTLYARWTAKTYTVKLDKLGGTSGADQFTATTGVTPNSIDPPSLAHYTFQGYYTEKDGKGTQYFNNTGAGTKSWAVDGTDLSLYAYWTANEYYATLNAPEATAAGSPPSTYKAAYDTPADKLSSLTGTMPSRTGYTFDGYWTKDGAAYDQQYFDKEGKPCHTWNIGADGTSLYAKWNPRPSKISFDPNLMPDGNPDQTWTSDEATLSSTGNTYTTTGYFELTYPKLPTLTRNGYIFTGWYSSRNCLPDEFVRAGYTQVEETEEKPQTLYAGWEHAQITVMYQLSKGLQLPKQVRYLEPYGEGYTLDRTGYDFKGWFMQDGSESGAWGDQIVYLAGGDQTVVKKTEQHTVYAKYDAHRFNVSFDPGAGSLSEGAGYTIPVTYDQPYGTLPTPNPPADQPDWIFGGWYLESGSYMTRIETDSIVKTDQNHTLYAKWVLGQQLISFDVDDGTPIASITVDLDYPYNVNHNWPAGAERKGYTFLSWNTKKDGTGETLTGDTICSSKQPIVAYAQWKPDQVQITLNPGEGAKVNGQPTQKVTGDFGATYGSLFGGKLPTPQKTDWTFVSWYNGEQPVYNGSQIDSTEPVELTAAWSQNVYTLVLHANGGTLTGMETSSSVSVGTAAELPGAANISRAGYKFKGWSEKQDGTGTLYTDRFTHDTNSVVVLYAVWERNRVENTVQHYQQRLDGTYPDTPTNTTKEMADAGSIFYAKAQEVTGFAPLYSDPSVVSGTVPEDKGLTLKLYYERKRYPVSVTTGEGCTVSLLSDAANGLVTEGDQNYIRHGGKYRFKIALDTGFDPATAKVLVNGIENAGFAGKVGQELALDVTADTQLSVTASRKVFTVTPPAAIAGYQIMPVSGSFQAEYGKDWSFTIVLDPPYSQSELIVLADGQELAPVDNVYTIKSVKDNVSLEVKGLALNRYQVSYDTGVGYTIAPKDSRDVIYNGSHTFVLTLTPDYEGAVPVVRSNMGAPLSMDGVSGLDYTYTLSNVTMDQHITVEPLVVEHFNVSLTAGTGYNIVPASSTVVRRGGSFSFSVSVAAAVDATSMIVTAIGASGKRETLTAVGGTYTISNITEDQTVTVTGLRKPSYKVAVIEGTGFTASPQSGSVDYGGSFSFTITLDETYSAADPVVKANYQQELRYKNKNGLTYTYELTNITENTDINVSGLSKPQYEITWIVEGGQSVSRFEYGSLPKYGAAPEKSPSMDHSYVFKGWRDQDSGMFYDAALPRVMGNATYVAEFKQVRRTYEVIWVSAGATHRESLPYGAESTFAGIDEFTTGRESDGYYDYTFSGWSDGKRIYTSNAALPIVTGPVTYVAQFTAKQRSLTLTVRYVDATNGSVLSTATESVTYNTQYRVSAPSYPGLAPSQAVASGLMPAHDLTLTVYYYKDTDTPYTVLHQQERLAGGYQTIDTETPRGTPGQAARAIPRSYDGFTVQSIPSATIAEDGTTTVIIQYTRNSYSAIWDPNGGAFADDYAMLPRTVSLRYGAPLTAPEVIHATDAVNSYTFAGWDGTVPETMPANNIGYTAYWTPSARMYTVTVDFADQDGNALAGVSPVSGKFSAGSDYYLSGFPAVSGKIASQTSVSGVMPAANVNVTVVYYDESSATAYTVKHYLANAAGAYAAEPVETETRTGFVGRQTSETGKNYDGYTVDHVEQATVTEDGKAVVKAYYARRYYTVTWDAGGGTFPGGAANQLMSVRYGAAVSAPSSPTKAADANYTYTFSGWYPSVAGEMPSYDVTYTAQYIRTPRTYTLTVQYLYADGTQAKEAVVKENMSVGESYRIASPEVSGYAANRTVVTGVMPASDTTETVTYVSTSGVEYTVKHVREAVGGDIEETEVLRGTTGAQTSALPRSYDGYTAQKVQQTTIRADGTAAVEIRYTRNSYQVVWNGNGGTIGGQKTVTRTVKYGEMLTPPSTPVKNGDAQFGYAFAGWDPSVPQTMPAGDQTFFATWSAVQNQYTLTVHYKKADGGEAAPSKSEVYTVGQNYTVSSPAVEGMTPNLETVTGIMPAADTEITVTYYPNNATRYTVKHLQKDAAGEGYTLAETEYLRGTAGEQTKAAAKTYAGFKKPSSVTQQTISSETETVVEIQYERESYTVTWNAGDGQFDGNAATKISTVKYGAAITGAPTPTKAADDLFTYRFTGWSPSVADTMPAWDVAYTAQYERTAKPYTLTVLYRFADGTTAHEPHTEQVSTGGSYNVESPSIEGYAPNQSVVTGTMPAKDTEILVTYVSTKGVTYKVQHLLEQEDGTYGPIKDEQVQRGQPGAQTAAVPKIYEGYTAETPEQQTILANGNTTVQIKYARKGYQVTWNAAGGKVNGEDRWTQTVKYGASITKPADPTRTSDAGYAYTFGGWDAEIPETMPAGELSFTAKWNTNRQTYRLTVRYQYENGTEAHASQDYQFIVGESYEIKDIPAVEGYRPNVTSVKGTMPAKDETVTVVYYPETGTQYTVKHLLQPVSGEAYELADTETLRGETGKESKAAARSYPGFTAQRVVQKPIAADGSTLVEVRYTRNEYTVTWNAGEGAFSGGEKSKTATYRYGAAIDRPTNLTRPADANFDYVFTGWTPEVPETMPPQNVTYTAQYGRAAQSYQLTVTYKMGDGTAAPEAHQETVTAGRSYRVVSPKVEGYTPSIAIVTGTMPSHDTEVLVTYYSNQGVQYKVVHKLQNLNGTAYEQADFDLLYGQTGTQTRAEPRVYTGFTPQAIEQQTVNADGGTVVEILYTRNSYKVTWNGAGGKVNGEDETIQSVKYGGSITSPTRLAKDEDVNYSYTFSKWDKTIPSEMPANDLYFIAQWDTDERSYEVTVSYQNKDGSEAFEDISDMYAIGKDYAIYTPEKDGYFPSLETVTGTMPANDLAFTVTYFPNTDAKYIVKHVLEPLPDMPMLLAVDDTDGIVYVEETMGGTVDEETQARPMPIPGFTAETYTQETIGGDTVVTIRYKRNEYDVVWDGNGGKWGEDETQTTTLLYGQRIAEPEEPTREADANSGYTFLSWGAKLPETMPAENLTYVARWSTAARDYTYTVKFVCEDGATAPEPITGTLAAGSAYTFTDFPALDGYVAIPNSLTGIMPASDLTLTVTYYPSAMGVPYKVEQYMEQADGSCKAEKTAERIGIAGQMTAETAEELAHYTARPVEQQKILGSGETVVKIYYERKGYTVTFDGNGGALTGAASVRGKWGAAVTAPTATREGYTFEGWLPAFSGTIPQADATYQAQWKTNSGGGTGGGDSGGGGGAGGGGGGATGPVEPDKPGTDDAGFTPCDGGESCPTKGTFLDNPYGSWYHNYVDYVFTNGLMKGVSSDRFAPDETLTRGMLVTILYRMAGSPAVSGASPFADVAEGKWYTDAILWATQTDVAGGYGNDRFGPDDPITREQTAAILYRYAVLKGFDTDGREELSSFTDANEVSAWAREAMQWCVQKSLITGRTEQELAPAGTATRAEIAAILSRYCGQVAK
ncbi:InlB B-repeat-containing protein [Agathobaculum sp. NTUH-O15-33]|uniref:InlB B-repeat-containing protein n=1 Tax=Agathobaculum sp. NTUH-O15-33 TaxID=3079302 RepID=UPI0029589E50|nr:InlB B-repeat-containing protein [Agathobaculum sp. NTUH-O15-33]WNX83118.1 InlB B-repeat-containing protein [Agathobaculum sp. NTUH-O15-33]